MTFTRKQLYKYLPKQKANTLINALRRENLGKNIPLTTIEKHRYGKAPRTMWVYEFDTNEVINTYTEKIKDCKSSPFRTPNKNWLEHWNNIITIMKEIEK